MNVSFSAIGRIRSPFHHTEGMPIQPSGAKDVEGTVEVDAMYTDGLVARAPRRPNPIGISTVALLKRNKNLLLIKGVDVLDGTPLLDIKPYVPEFDVFQVSSVGWLDKKQQQAKTWKSDRRFASE
jgi:tRNA (Thr-GGU) A37 N-methylase